YRSGIREADPAHPHPGEVFLVLSRMFGNSYVESRLRRIATAGELAAKTRIFAAHALGRVAGRAEAIAMMASLAAETLPVADLAEAIRAILALDADATQVIEPILREIGRVEAEPDDVLDAARLAVRIGRPRQAVELA